MNDAQTGIGDRAATPEPQPAEPSAEDTRTDTFSLIRISPKWQMVLIGGAFIAINIMMMVIFLVAIFLRR